MTTRTPRIVTHTCPKCGHRIQAPRTATATCQASLRCQRNGTLIVTEASTEPAEASNYDAPPPQSNEPGRRWNDRPGSGRPEQEVPLMADSSHTSLPVIDPTASEIASPGRRATCVNCDGVLIAKCGEINRWHWAHEAGDTECPGTGLESAWHVAWKIWAATFGAQTEVKHGRHRADIVHADGRIIELQSNYLAADQIAKREAEYGDQLTWIYRMTPGRWNRLINSGDGWFTWRRPAPSMGLHKAPVVWHYADRLFPIDQIDTTSGEFRIRFTRGESDNYGPNLYHSDPAPFDVLDAMNAIQRLQAA